MVNIQEKKIKDKKKLNLFFDKIESNEIKSDSFNIFEFFGGEDIFKIKTFQRKYNWNTKQVVELIQDIEEYDENKIFFLGTIIIKKTKNINKIEYSIIDGQQRVTTLFLILKSIELKIKGEYKIKDFSDPDVNSIRSLYLLKSNKDEKLKIEGSRKHTKELEKILKCDFVSDIEKINNKNFVIKSYIENTKKILESNFLKNSETIKSFTRKIKNISFSLIGLGNSIDENKVFEDLNSKGSPLLIEDLLRNYFYKKTLHLIKNEHHNLKIEKLEEKTNNIMNEYENAIIELENFLIIDKIKYRSLFTNKINRFFKNYILYRINNSTKLNEDNDRRMFVQFKNETTKKITCLFDLRNELNQIDKYFQFCIFMSSYNETNLETKKNNNVNNEKYLLNSLEFYPFIYSFYSNWEEKYYDSIILFSTIIYIYLTIKNIDIWKFLKENLNKIKTKALSNSKNKKRIMNELLSDLLYNKENLFNKEYDLLKNLKYDVRNKMSDNSDIYNSKEFKRFLHYYFSSKNTTNQITLMDKKYDLEHIISNNNNWDSEKSDLNEIIHFRRVNKIENLCLIEKEINKVFSNVSFKEKKIIYKKKFIDKDKISKIDDINKTFNRHPEVEIEKILDNRKNDIINFSDNFINNIYNKWDKSIQEE